MSETCGYILTLVLACIWIWTAFIVLACIWIWTAFEPSWTQRRRNRKQRDLREKTLALMEISRRTKS